MTTQPGLHVLVTGGTSGIGAGIARAFQSAGARVLVTGLTAAEAAAARADGLDASPLDVRDDAAVSAFAGRLERLDVLVNCAGMIRRRDEHEVGVFAQVVDINLTGTMRMCTACRPLLAKQGGGDRQHRVDAQLLRRWPRARLRREQGRRRAAHQGAGDRLCATKASASTRSRRAGSRPR